MPASQAASAASARRAMAGTAVRDELMQDSCCLVTCSDETCNLPTPYRLGPPPPVDVQPEMVALLERSARREGIANIEPSLGTETDVRLPPGSVDLAIMVDVYHELSRPHEVLASLVRALKPGGRVVFVEYRAEDPAVPIKTLHKMSEAQIRREAEVQALTWERTAPGLPWQHVVVFRKDSSTRR